MNSVCFDEQLSSQYGPARGTGTCIQVDEGVWKIVQYHLSFPIPNDIAVKVTDLMKHLMAKQNQKTVVPLPGPVVPVQLSDAGPQKSSS